MGDRRSMILFLISEKEKILFLLFVFKSPFFRNFISHYYNLRYNRFPIFSHFSCQVFFSFVKMSDRKVPIRVGILDKPLIRPKTEVRCDCFPCGFYRLMNLIVARFH
jgi:hypothetical protein